MALEKIRGPLPMPGSLAVVVGAGRSGIAAARLLAKRGIKARLLERDSSALTDAQTTDLRKAGIDVLIGPHTAAQFEGAALAIPSPGLPISKLNQWLGTAKPEIISELELAWRCLDNEPVLAITGTSGKTTTASLAAAMLKTRGLAVFLGGNIGTPLSEYALAERKADALVIECSSFQLQGCSTFSPRVAILLNISPNHLDHHKDMAEYAEAKFRIFRCQDEGDLAILGPGLEKAAERFAIPARKIHLKDSGNFADVALPGAHNRLNAEAAWLGAKFFGASLDDAKRAAASFAPLPHRLELVGEINGASYVNDSKCTTVAALKAALEAFDRPIRLLAGGKFKGGDLASLAPLIKKKVIQIALFGASREHFEQAWAGLAPISWHETLREAVARLKGSAAKGDVILLTPATSSYDAYANYMERGDDFRRIVSEMS